MVFKPFSHLFSRMSGEIPSAQPTVFEYYFDTKKGLWVPWVDVIPKYVHDPEKKFSEILVPTVDTVRTTWLLELMVNIKRPVVLVGETGTSKSATTANFLRGLDKDATVCCTQRKFSNQVIFCLFFLKKESKLTEWRGDLCV